MAAAMLLSCQNDVSSRTASESADTVNQAARQGGGGDDGEDDEPEATEQEGDEYYYSPFVLELEGGRFNTISFKDVGLDRESPDPNDPLLEVIAESLAYRLTDHDALDYRAQVVYDEKVLDPSNHLSCGLNHIYVDVWHSTSPDRWGFSLWSGCGESDNFAWKEVPDSAPDAELTEHVEPLTSGIVEAIAEAAEAGCFQKSC